jgi:hypothetical protein
MMAYEKSMPAEKARLDMTVVTAQTGPEQEQRLPW